MSDLEDYIQEAIDNIRDDRTVTKELLNDVITHMSKDPTSHREVGQVAAKYVETLQRSNEQLVKAATLIHKKQAGNTGLSDGDKKEIYDMLGSAAETEGDS